MNAKISKLAKKHDIEVVEQIERIKFYEIEGPVGPMFTACLIFGNNGVFLARGVSICSIQEGFNRKEGRNRAIGRAIKAITNASNGDPIIVSVRNESDMYTKNMKIGESKAKQAIKIPKYLHIKVAAGHFSYKSEFAPELTDFEKRLLGV